MQGQAGDEEAAVDVKLYSHRWRRWLPPKPRNMDSNRASQEQDQDPEQEEPEAFPGVLSAEETDNSSQIEVGVDSRDFSAYCCIDFDYFIQPIACTPSNEWRCNAPINHRSTCLIV